MLMLESDAKELLAAFGVAVPPGHILTEAAAIEALELSYPAAVKAQVPSGGRGKAGGVVRAENPEAAGEILRTRYGDRIPPAVLVEPWLPIERELYLSVAVDGRAGGFVVLYSPQGGVDVEEGGAPARCDVGLPQNFRAHRLREILYPVETDPAVREKVVALAKRLLRLTSTRDCLTVEINPLAKLEDGSLVAVDAKIARDEAAAFRAGDIRAAVEEARRREPEAVARCLRAGLALVRLKGEVGIISGGAGMTMATMDMVADAGGRPACFLDCSGNPTPAGYRLAFETLDAEPDVRAILVSIFGGGTHMDRVARNLRDILRDRGRGKPVVFRLNGTNADQVDGFLGEVGARNHASLESAAAAVVEIAKKGP